MLSRKRQISGDLPDANRVRPFLVQDAPSAGPSRSPSDLPIESGSMSSVLQRLEDLETQLASLSSQSLQPSLHTAFGDPSQLHEIALSAGSRHDAGYREATENLRVEEWRPKISLPATNHEPGIGHIGQWWTLALEQTLDWPGVCQLRLQKPSTISLTDLPLPELQSRSSSDSSSISSLPRLPDYERNIGLDDPQEMSGFVDRFLMNIHVRNPLVEPALLRDQIATTAEIGFQWDGPSCLLLIACACGAIACPFNVDTLESYSAASISASDYQASRKYFDAGRKRLGLLVDQPSQLAVQCYFYAGVYYMCALRPSAAWRSFNSASILYRHYSERTEGDKPRGGSDVNEVEHVSTGSRLYWSCIKSEREVAIELGIHSTNISRVEYTRFLPSLPSPPDLDNMAMESPATASMSAASPMVKDTSNPSIYRQSWFYYLTDITIRKIEMQIEESLGIHGEVLSGNTPAERESFFNQIIATLSDADAQITAHYSTLPDIIAFDLDEEHHSADDLREYLRYRMLGTRQILYRPALYIVLQHSDDMFSISPSLRDQTIAMANQALAWDLHFTRHGLTTHRHPGTWLLIRHVTRCALELLAAWRTQSPWLILEPQLHESVEACKVALRYWSEESADAQLYLDWIESAQSDC